jgi:uncharacterized protein YidB (DUF937 family)
LGWRRNQRHQSSTPKGSEVRTVIRHVTKRRETDERCLERDALLRVVLLAKPHSTEMVRNSNFEASSNKDDDMSRGYPSMTALLGLLAIAGYQNRDKIAEMLRGAQSNPADPAAPTKAGAREATPGNLGGILGGASIGDTLSGGLRELMDAFKQKGQGDVADSWVARGPNKQIAPAQLEQTIGADVLQTLSQQTGMSREEILARLSKNLPDAVDKYTPEGRIPSAADFS